MWKVSKELSKDRNACKSFIKTRLNHRYVENINSNMMCCAIWYHLYNLKHVKNTNGGELFLVKLKTSNREKITNDYDISNYLL